MLPYCLIQAKSKNEGDKIPIEVRKADGEIQPFEPKKLIRSLLNAGSEIEIAQKVLKKVEKIIYNGITTRKLYSIAFKELRKVDNPTASRYQARWALMRLGKGEQGFSFEQFVASLFERLGYEVKINQILTGKCGITHEVDVVAEKDDKRIMVECKHRSKPGLWINVQTPLYVYARYLDLKNHFDGIVLVTNSKFSEQSIKYSKCVGIKLLAWDYPEKGNLRTMVDKYAIYPITVLSSVDNNSLMRLLKNNITTVADLLLCPEERIFSIIGRKNAMVITKEAEYLLKH